MLEQPSDRVTVADVDTCLRRGLDEGEIEPAALHHGDRGSRIGEMDRRKVGPAKLDALDAPLDGAERRVRYEPLGLGRETSAAQLCPWQRPGLEEDDLSAARREESGGRATGRPGSDDSDARPGHPAAFVVRSATKFQAITATAATARP